MNRIFAFLAFIGTGIANRIKQGKQRSMFFLYIFLHISTSIRERGGHRWDLGTVRAECKDQAQLGWERWTLVVKAGHLADGEWTVACWGQKSCKWATRGDFEGIAKQPELTFLDITLKDAKHKVVLQGLPRGGRPCRKIVEARIPHESQLVECNVCPVYSLGPDPFIYPCWCWEWTQLMWCPDRRGDKSQLLKKWFFFLHQGETSLAYVFS